MRNPKNAGRRKLGVVSRQITLFPEQVEFIREHCTNNRITFSHFVRIALDKSIKEIEREEYGNS